MTDQEKREKVITHLQILRTWCAVNPYYEIGLSAEDCVKVVEWLDDALALLKAQEPRVMTLEEVRDEADYMYLEEYSKTGSDLYGCAIQEDCDRYGIELFMNGYDIARERWSDYGKTWRCWTSRPDEKRRAETPWK